MDAPHIDRPWLDKDATPLVRIENITKKFGNDTAVNDVSLDIYKGELFCLLGGSGCGKSTLLRMLAGFENPTAGRIVIDGQDMAGVSPHKRPTNMMFQSYALFPHMSVIKNVMYGLRHQGVAKAEAEDTAMDMLRLVKLDEFSGRKPNQLSGGQRQRVALARALVKQPTLLLLDEPLGALDKKLREETQFELIRIQETLGVTFIVVTHDQEEAMTLASRIGVMRDGVIEQVGEPREVYEYPQSRFVADFLGEVNFFSGRLIEDEADHAAIENEDIQKLRIGHGISAAPEQMITVAVRPEKLEISRKKSRRMDNACKGSISEIGYLGGHSVFHVTLPSGNVVKAMRANRIRDTEDEFTWDDEVYVGWSDNSAVILTQ